MRLSLPRVVVIGAALALLAYFLISSNMGLIDTCSPSKFFAPQASCRNLQIGSQLFKLEVADTAAKQEQGLSGRDSIAPDQGMIFIFNKPGNYPFWMKDMKFPLDIIWLYNNQIIYAVENAPSSSAEFPPVYYPGTNADTVIELNAGTLHKLGLKIGDRLAF